MNLRYRKMIAQCVHIHKLARIIAYNSGFLYYKRLYICNQYKFFFDKIRGIKKGKRCFIIGNGPSLREDDLARLEKEDCFAANEIHRLFDKINWRPTYYVIMDRYTKTKPETIRDLECSIVFLGDYYCRFNKVLRKDAICLHQHFNYSNSYNVSSDISKKVTMSPTVSFACMQIAAYMGYTEIYLLGFDHSYSYEFDKKGVVVNTGIKTSHFFRDEKPADIIADVSGMTKAYKAFRKYAEEYGIVVKNATRGGKLDVFERVDFEEIIGGKEL